MRRQGEQAWARVGRCMVRLALPNQMQNDAFSVHSVPGMQFIWHSAYYHTCACTDGVRRKVVAAYRSWCLCHYWRVSEINCKHSRSWYKVYCAAGVWHLISHVRIPPYLYGQQSCICLQRS